MNEPKETWGDVDTPRHDGKQGFARAATTEFDRTAALTAGPAAVDA